MDRHPEAEICIKILTRMQAFDACGVRTEKAAWPTLLREVRGLNRAPILILISESPERLGITIRKSAALLRFDRV